MCIKNIISLISILFLVSCSTPLYINSGNKYSELNESQKYKISGNIEKEIFSMITGLSLSTAVRLDSIFTVGGNYTYGNRKYSEEINTSYTYLYKTNGQTFDFDIGVQPLKKGKNFIMELHAGAGWGSTFNTNYSNGELDNFSNFKYTKFLAEIDMGYRFNGGQFEILFPVNFSVYHFNDIDYLYNGNFMENEYSPFLNMGSFGMVYGFTNEKYRINIYSSVNFEMSENNFNYYNLMNFGLEFTVYDLFEKPIKRL